MNTSIARRQPAPPSMPKAAKVTTSAPAHATASKVPAPAPASNPRGGVAASVASHLGHLGTEVERQPSVRAAAVKGSVRGGGSGSKVGAPASVSRHSVTFEHAGEIHPQRGRLQGPITEEGATMRSTKNHPHTVVKTTPSIEGAAAPDLDSLLEDDSTEETAVRSRPTELVESIGGAASEPTPEFIDLEFSAIDRAPEPSVRPRELPARDLRDVEEGGGDSMLARYFRDMALHPVMGPEEELGTARTVERERARSLGGAALVRRRRPSTSSSRSTSTCRRPARKRSRHPRSPSSCGWRASP